MRIVIVGNSGSGKTWLARRLAGSNAGCVVHLDELFWAPGGFDRKRAPAERATLIAASKAADSWIVEGVFGELAEYFMDEAELLIWLDLAWPVCHQRLLRRGSESKAQMGREQSVAGLAELIDWAANYRIRGGGCSFAAHQRLFDRFGGERFRLTTESEVDSFLQYRLGA